MGRTTQGMSESLERARREQGCGDLAARLLAIGKDCASRLKEPFRTGDHGDLLYDEHGQCASGENQLR